mmetsp:Transcript_10398/g.31332  ORF Transcript_10398/g.31332 Transcript_10398/m.31332 type:complete len:273 (+) Transcript_10398:583-1401(+)
MWPARRASRAAYWTCCTVKRAAAQFDMDTFLGLGSATPRTEEVSRASPHWAYPSFAATTCMSQKLPKAARPVPGPKVLFHFLWSDDAHPNARITTSGSCRKSTTVAGSTTGAPFKVPSFGRLPTRMSTATELDASCISATGVSRPFPKSGFHSRSMAIRGSRMLLRRAAIAAGACSGVSTISTCTGPMFSVAGWAPEGLQGALPKGPTPPRLCFMSASNATQSRCGTATGKLHQCRSVLAAAAAVAMTSEPSRPTPAPDSDIVLAAVTAPAV